MRKYLVAGNWKMNGSKQANSELLDGLRQPLAGATAIDVCVCPPDVYLDSVGAQRPAAVILGAQDVCEQERAGAFTGETHGAMLGELGVTMVIVGHSERRSLYGDTDERVARKFTTAQSCGLAPILCLGETLAEREAGNMQAVLARQLEAVIAHAGIAAFANAVIAYEPVWAIGTGKTASVAQAQEAHAYIRGILASHDAKIANSTRLLYGGSVKPDNAQSLFSCPDVDGGLIGGASLKASDFAAICLAAQALAG